MHGQRGTASRNTSSSTPMSQGLQAVFLENRESLLRFLRARGAVDADDLVQEIWLRASSQASGPIANPRSYLFRIAHNMMIDIHRASSQRTRREKAWTEANSDVASGVSDEPSAERSLVAREMLEQVQNALDDMGEPTATIFRRFRIDGIAQKIIAGDLAVSLATVEKHLQKAYRMVAAIKKEFDTE